MELDNLATENIILDKLKNDLFTQVRLPPELKYEAAI